MFKPLFVQLPGGIGPLPVILRSVFLQEAGWAELWPDAVALLVWGMAIPALAIARFHKRLD